MSVVAALNRIAELQSVLGGPAPAPAPAAAPSSSFATALAQADPATRTFASTAALPAAPLNAGGTSAGQAILANARNEVGQAEQPPGSNDSPRIAQYRQATAGSGVGPWCSYFVSWAARGAGVPIGDGGQGLGRVDDVWAWAERSGKAVPAAGTTPAPGDLIVWDEHIGVVESVDPDGRIHTIEGNSSDRVSRRDYGPDGGGAIGYVRLG
jgi:hypothetical protein